MRDAKDRLLRHGVRAGMALTGLALAVACGGGTTQAGGLEVRIDTNLSAPSGYDRLKVTVEQQTSPEDGGTWGSPLLQVNDPVPNPNFTLPARVSIAAGSAADQEARITAGLYLGSVLVVQNVAQVQVPTDRVGELDLFLSKECVGVTCPANQTCNPDDGTCVSSMVVDVPTFGEDGGQDGGADMGAGNGSGSSAGTVGSSGVVSSSGITGTTTGPLTSSGGTSTTGPDTTSSSGTTSSGFSATTSGFSATTSGFSATSSGFSTTSSGPGGTTGITGTTGLSSSGPTGTTGVSSSGIGGIGGITSSGVGITSSGIGGISSSGIAGTSGTCSSGPIPSCTAPPPPAPPP
jgi:hypothetical protein